MSERERGLESHGNMADSLQGLSLRTKASGRGLLCSLSVTLVTSWQLVHVCKVCESAM